LKLGEIVRGNQICNFLGKIQPPTATKIKLKKKLKKKNKKKIASPSAEKNPENVQILKLQYLDFPESVSNDFFFQLGCFSERDSDIQPFSANFLQKYTENFDNVAALFFLLRKKKSAKIKNICPQCLSKESALIPLVKNQILNTKSPQQIYNNNMQKSSLLLSNP
jgi:hypothetical protein